MIHQALLSQFSLLEEFYQLKTKIHSGVLVLVNLDPLIQVADKTDFKDC